MPPSRTTVTGIALGSAIVLALWLHHHRSRKLVSSGEEPTADDKGREGDERIEADDFVCPIPDDTAALLVNALGDARFAAYQRALTRPPRRTHLRVQYLPDIDGGTSLGERVEAAAAELDAALRAHPWAKERLAGDGALVQRHPVLDDVLVVASLPHAAAAASSPEHRVVIVDRLCGEAVLKGADIFARGVLVCSLDLAAGQPVEVWCDLDDHRTQDPKDKGDTKRAPKERERLEDKPLRDAARQAARAKAKEADKAGKAGAVLRGSSLWSYKGRRVRLGWGVAAMGRVEIMGREAAGTAVRVAGLSGGALQAPPLNGLLSRRLFSQSLPCTVVGHVLSPRPGETVIDMCAAPGGKVVLRTTTHLASLMRNEGTLFALDHSRRKVAALNELLASLGFQNAIAVHLDAAKAVAGRAGAGAAKGGPPKKAAAYAPDGGTDGGVDGGADGGPTDGAPPSSRVQRRERVAAARAKGRGPRVVGGSAVERHPGFAAESFDAILLDPPCSALGLRPRLRVDMSLAELGTFVSLQRGLLFSAVRLLKPGGRLVFSTCTVNPQENEGQVRFALDTYPFLSLVDASVGGVGDVGLLDDGSGDGLSEVERRKVLRFHSQADGDEDSTGFFIAKFIKTGSMLG